jgi:Fe-S-cluster-containing dehydrogenase component
MATKEGGFPVAVNYRWVIIEEGGTYPTPTRLSVTSACNHCDEPACLKGCPVSAISKRAGDGIVLIDQEKCIGCRQCEKACPYGAPQFNEQSQKSEKCTMCVHRIDAGLTPACADTCPTAALTYEPAFPDGSEGENAPSGFVLPALTEPKVRFTQSF